jgi:hypothetical protein
MKRFAVVWMLLVAPATAEPLHSVRMTTEGVCAVTHHGEIRCSRRELLPSIDVKARDFVPAFHAILVRDDGALVRIPHRKAPTDAIAPEPLNAPFVVQRAALVENYGATFDLCIFGSKGELACTPWDLTGPKATFARLKGTFSDVQFTLSSVWALDGRGALWCRGGDACAPMQVAAKAAPKAGLLERTAFPTDPLAHVPDADFWRVTDNVKRVWARDATCIEREDDATNLVCWGFGSPPHKIPRPVGDEIEVAGRYLCARTKDTVRCTDTSPGSKNTFTLSAQGAVKLHTTDQLVCVENTRAELSCASVGIDALTPLPWIAR